MNRNSRQNEKKNGGAPLKKILRSMTVYGILFTMVLLLQKSSRSLSGIDLKWKEGSYIQGLKEVSLMVL